MTICLGPDELPEGIESNFSMTHKDFEVAEVYLTVRSATMVYENHCEQFSDNFESCQASSVICPENFMPDFKHTTAGLPGFMSEVAKAADQGKLHDLFNKHVDSELMNFDADEVTNLDVSNHVIRITDRYRRIESRDLKPIVNVKRVKP